MRDFENVFYEVKNAIRAEAENKLENGAHWIYPNEAYRLGISDIAQDVLVEALEKILDDEKMKSKLTNEISRRVTKKYKEREARLRAEEKKNLQLWKITGGSIPCLNECGFHRNQTKESVLEGFNTFICKDCTEKLEAEGKSTHILFNKSVYQLFNIK